MINEAIDRQTEILQIHGLPTSAVKIMKVHHVEYHRGRIYSRRLACYCSRPQPCLTGHDSGLWMELSREPDESFVFPTVNVDDIVKIIVKIDKGRLIPYLALIQELRAIHSVKFAYIPKGLGP